MAEAQKRIKKMLEDYKGQRLLIEIREEEIKEWQERRKFCEVHKLMDCLKPMDELISRLEAEKRNKEKYCNTVLMMIDNVEDNDQREILKRRYIYGQTLNNIADMMYFSRSTISRKYKQALDALAEQKALNKVE